MAFSKEQNLISPSHPYNGRSLAGHRSKLAQSKGTDAIIKLMKTAMNASHITDCVLFDTWFSTPAQLVAIKSPSLDAIAMIKKNFRTHCDYERKQLSINKIFGICKKHRDHSKYLLLLNVIVGKGQKIPAKSYVAATIRIKRTDLPLSAQTLIILTAMFESIYSVFYVTETQIDMFYRRIR